MILVAMVFGYGWLISNPPYIIEIRERAPGGTVTYGWEESTSPFNNPQLDVLRQHTFSRIYHGVYYAGLTYHFSRSGRVFAIEGLETSGGYRMVRSWKWSGDPHKFPYYDFSHEWRKNQA